MNKNSSFEFSNYNIEFLPGGEIRLHKYYETAKGWGSVNDEQEKITVIQEALLLLDASTYTRRTELDRLSIIEARR